MSSLIWHNKQPTPWQRRKQQQRRQHRKRQQRRRQPLRRQRPRSQQPRRRQLRRRPLRRRHLQRSLQRRKLLPRRWPRRSKAYQYHFGPSVRSDRRKRAKGFRKEALRISDRSCSIQKLFSFPEQCPTTRMCLVPRPHEDVAFQWWASASPRILRSVGRGGACACRWRWCVRPSAWVV